MGEESNQSRAVFEQEALPHLDSLYNFALYLTRNPSDSEDLVQEAMFRAFRFFDHYEPGTNCRAWLFRILRNTFVNEYRRKVNRPAEVPIEAEEALPEDAEPIAGYIADPEAELLQDLYDDEVTHALEQLPDDFREVVLMRDVEGFSYQEIAHVIERPVGTVRSRIARGREMLRRRLMSYAKEHGYLRNGPGTPQGYGGDD
jgi:RNA polymerase sigma-70 factor (ECF subfamily)